jgi:hypothetical protein
MNSNALPMDTPALHRTLNLHEINEAVERMQAQGRRIVHVCTQYTLTDASVKSVFYIERPDVTCTDRTLYQIIHVDLAAQTTTRYPLER